MIDERIYRTVSRNWPRPVRSQHDQLARRQHQHARGRPRDHQAPRRQLGQLKPHDLIETGMEKNDSGVALASTELLAHRTIYHADPGAGHCATATRARPSPFRSRAMRSCRSTTRPRTCSRRCRSSPEEFASGTPEMANNLAEALQSYKIVMLRGHGSFATGQTLDEAFLWSSTLEEACEIIL